jgi:hypothetical protein
MCYTLFQFLYLYVYIFSPHIITIIVLMFLFFTFKMVDSNVIIWSLLASFGITKSLYILFVLLSLCLFYVFVIRFRSCEASLLYCCCYCWFTQINLKLSLYFLSHFGQLELLDDFRLGMQKLQQGQVICMFFVGKMLSCSYIFAGKSFCVNPI